MAQTQVSMDLLALHPGDSVAVQQGLPPQEPQSEGHDEQVSLPSQVPSPHTAVGVPQVPHSSEVTSLTHLLSHWVAQQ